MLGITQKIFRKLNRQVRKSVPNVHMPAKSAKLRRVDERMWAYLRPSFSDSARIQEYLQAIYAPRNQFTSAVQQLKPRFLIDVGANVGLSTLALLREFPSLIHIAGIEAEHENYETLKLNYNYWQENLDIDNKNVRRLVPIYAVASNDSVRKFTVTPKRLTGGISASGTFQFVKRPLSPETRSLNNEMSIVENEIVFSSENVTIEDVLRQYLGKNQEGVAIVKVDIEGGEEDLFSGPCDWMRETAFLTVEVHDYMGALHSSRPLIKKLFEYDFAIIPREDVLHCYNRSLLSLK